MRASKAAQTGIALTIAGTMVLTGCDGDGKKNGGKAGAPVAPTTAAPTTTATTEPSPTTTETPAAGVPQGGNGVAARPPREILQSARIALSTASSVLVNGSFSDQGGRVTINIRLGQNQARGTLSAPSKTGQILTVELRVVGGKYYARAGRDFWAGQVNAAAADRLANRWIIAPPSALGAGQKFSGVQPFSAILSEDTVKVGSMQVTGPANVNGVPAVGLAGGGGVIYVATTGKPYPLRLGAPQGGAAERLDFTQYDVPFTVVAPPEAIDFSTVKQS